MIPTDPPGTKPAHWFTPDGERRCPECSQPLHIVKNDDHVHFHAHCWNGQCLYTSTWKRTPKEAIAAWEADWAKVDALRGGALLTKASESQQPHSSDTDIQCEAWENMPDDALLYADSIGSVWLDPGNKLVIYIKGYDKFEAQLPSGVRIQRHPGTKVVGQL